MTFGFPRQSGTKCMKDWMKFIRLFLFGISFWCSYLMHAVGEMTELTAHLLAISPKKFKEAQSEVSEYSPDPGYPVGLPWVKNDLGGILEVAEELYEATLYPEAIQSYDAIL